jgi:phytoene dehydrogenase-like protein
VLVVEHNHQAGGLMSGMRRRGFYFDVGCQSFEDMGIVFPLLAAYGLSDLARFRRARYRLVMPGLDAVVESIPQIREAFQRAYPASAAALGEVFALHQRTSELISRLFVPERLPYLSDHGPSLARWALSALSGPGGASPRALLGLLRDLPRWLYQDFGPYYEGALPPSPARDLLGRCGYSRMNVFVASAFWHLWAHDYWYPEGGLQGFFDRWVERLEARGVSFLFKRTVTALPVAGGRVEAVVTGRGERLLADQVVFTGDLRQALRLVGPGGLGAARADRVARAPHSDALVSVYLGLDLAPEALRERLRTAHVFYFPRADCRTALDPADPAAHRAAFLEITGHAMFDPALAPPGRSALVLQAFTRHDWQDGWGTGLTGDPGRDERATPRPPRYRRLKRQVADELLGVLEGLLPGAASRVAWLDVGAPPSTVRFTRNAFGGSCGFALTWRGFPFPRPLGNAATALDNLHLAGHFTVWPGAVPTAALSGRIAAARADARLRRRTSRLGRARAAPAAGADAPSTTRGAA